MELYKRDVFDKVENYLGDDTVLVFLGARQVGKTHILKYIQNYLENKKSKTFYYDLEFPDLLEILNQGTHSFISDLSSKGYVQGEQIFVFIDEIQYLDNPSSFLKIIADHNKNIHLIVSGSSTFDIKTKFKDSLVGRYLSFEVFPLSFKEFLRFKKSEYRDITSLSSSALIHIKSLYYEFIKYGSYPKIVLEQDEIKKKEHLFQLLDTYVRKDIKDLADITDVNKFNGMLKILASQSGQILNVAALSRETNISQPTLSKYLSILEETFVIKRVTPFSNSPSVEISKNPKIFFLDSGLQSLLWFRDFQSTLLGNVFETNVYSELVKKYDRESINFWRTKTGLEIDFVVQLDNLKLLPIEVKTNFAQFSKKSINSFLKKYKYEKWNVVGLEGKRRIPNMIYPWEV